MLALHYDSLKLFSSGQPTVILSMLTGEGHDIKLQSLISARQLLFYGWTIPPVSIGIFWIIQALITSASTSTSQSESMKPTIWTKVQAGRPSPKYSPCAR